MAQWTSDGSSAITSNGNETSCDESSPSGNVFNALWEDASGGGVSNGQHYWKLTVKQLSSDHMGLFVGLTDKPKFQAGWALKGLLYGGNLSNGSGLLVSEFGPSLKSGDTLGIFVSFNESNLQVYFDVNDKPLGLAFDLPKSTFEGIYPVVQFSAPGTVCIEKLPGTPTNLIREKPVFVGIEGDWKIKEFKINGVIQSLPISSTLRFTKSNEAAAAPPPPAESYSVHLHVVNSIGFNLSRPNPTSPWTTTGGMSTLMGSSPECMKFEGDMNTLKSNPSQLELNEGELILNNSAATMESTWERYSIEKSPVTENPFFN